MGGAHSTAEVHFEEKPCTSRSLVDGWLYSPNEGDTLTNTDSPAYLPLAGTSVALALADGNEARIPTYVLPHISMFAFLVEVWQISRYEIGVQRNTAFVGATTVAIGLTALEVMCINTLRHGVDTIISDRQIPAAITVVVLCMVLGYWPLSVEVLRHQGRAVSVDGMALTWGVLASFCSLASTRAVVHREARILGTAVYAISLVLEIGFLISHLIWKLRTRKVSSLAKTLGITFDELWDEYAELGEPFPFVESRKWGSRVRSASTVKAQARIVGASELGDNSTWTRVAFLPPATVSRN
ncbi:Uu.00g110930.m01.CDS01 [Anthostomella pinea]|uniref:Uu.00g110930.m01.CDS01 n=1 Tax=Anthostomella pinea TaxID=933095 RepID=A0AAI8VFZ3_9PEZI|nr:Uu.00g110930.m01.CDS01 [Anthostomella pinea]